MTPLDALLLDTLRDDAKRAIKWKGVAINEQYYAGRISGAHTACKLLGRDDLCREIVKIQDTLY